MPRAKVFALFLALTVGVVGSLQGQTRVRDIHDAMFGTASLSISATSEGIVQIQSRQRYESVLLRLNPERIEAWADSADRFVTSHVVAPGSDRLEFRIELSENDASSASLDLNRKVRGTSSHLSLFVSDRHIVNTVYADLTPRQSHTLISALRRAAAAARELSATRPPARASPSAPDFYFEFQVEVVAKQLVTSPEPAYPAALREQGVEGEAQAQFVVNDTGEVDPSTIKILKASHPEFGRAVRLALPGMRYSPAELNDKFVKQVVQQTFHFAGVR